MHAKMHLCWLIRTVIQVVVVFLVFVQAREPKAAIQLSELNAVFVPDKIGNPNGMQLCYVKDGQTRNIYLYTDDGKVRNHAGRLL